MTSKYSDIATIKAKLLTEDETLERLVQDLLNFAYTVVADQHNSGDDGNEKDASSSNLLKASEDRLKALKGAVQFCINKKKSIDQELLESLTDYDAVLRGSIAKGEQLSHKEVFYLEKIKAKDHQLLEKDEQLQKARLQAEDPNSAPKRRQDGFRDDAEKMEQLSRENDMLTSQIRGVLLQFQALMSQYNALRVDFARAQGFSSNEKKVGFDEYDDEPDMPPPSNKINNNKRKRANSDIINISDSDDMDVYDRVPTRATSSTSKKARLVTGYTKIAPPSSKGKSEKKPEPFKFKFTAIKSYGADGKVAASIPSYEFPPSLTLSYILDRIEILDRTLWSKKLNPDSEFRFLEFEGDAEFGAPARCVSATCLGKEWTEWRAADHTTKDGKKKKQTVEAGKWACKDCVAKGWPCFVGAKEGGLKLLPVHPDERAKRVVGKGQEAWFWVDLDQKVEDRVDEDEDDDENEYEYEHEDDF